MNDYVFDIFISHSIVLEYVEEDKVYTANCDLIENGPVNNLRRIKWFGISHKNGGQISQHGRTFMGFFDPGQLELLENSILYVNVIDGNGNIMETFPTLAQGFIFNAERKQLRTLNDIAAYNGKEHN
jgi:hypothetical protein